MSVTTRSDINTALLEQSEVKIKRLYPTLNSVLIDTKDERVYSGVYNSQLTLDSPQPVYSITKSVVALLVGIAIDQGLIEGTHQSITELLEVDIGKRQLDAHTRQALGQISLHHLLSMTAGFLWRDARLGVEPLGVRMTQQADWLDFILRLPIVRKRVGSFQYNSAVSHLLSVIISAVTGVSAERFAQQFLFGPLGIEQQHWPSDPQENSIGCWGLELSPNDLSKLGLLFLHKGRWKENQIVSGDWIALASTAHTPDYGYQWRLPRIDGCAAIMAQGLSGQIICVVPEHEVVVVATSRFAGRRRNLLPMFEEYWLPAVIGQ